MEGEKLKNIGFSGYVIFICIYNDLEKRSCYNFIILVSNDGIAIIKVGKVLSILFFLGPT